MVAFLKNGLGPLHIMEVRIHHCCNRSVCDLPQLPQGFAHFLNRLTRIDRDDSFRGFDEVLVRKSVADKAPYALAHFEEACGDDIALCGVTCVHSLTPGRGDHIAVIGVKTSGHGGLVSGRTDHRY